MKNKIKYGKFINNALHYASSPLVINGILTWTNDEKVFNEQGYFQIVNTDMPIRDGYFYTSTYVEQDGKLMQVWEEHEIPKPVEEIPVEAEEDVVAVETEISESDDAEASI